MKTSSSPARITRFLGAAALTGSLLAALTGCGVEDSADAAEPAASPASASASASAEPTAEANDELWGYFVRAVDGDTVEIELMDGQGDPTGEPNLEVSLLGVKAPDASACGGPEAAAYLESRILPGEAMTVTYDGNLKDAVDEDGNPLAYVTVGAGIVMEINALMVAEGYAAARHAGDGPAPENFPEYENSQKSAQESNKGLWAACGGVES